MYSELVINWKKTPNSGIVTYSQHFGHRPSGKAEGLLILLYYICFYHLETHVSAF